MPCVQMPPFLVALRELGDCLCWCTFWTEDDILGYSVVFDLYARSDILVLKHESRKIRYFWVVRKFKVLVFRSGQFGLLPAAA